MVARFPVPVITGIGHARDDSILDEIACIRTDTPSKAAAYILNTVLARAGSALDAYRQILTTGQGVLEQTESSAAWMMGRLERAARGRVDTEAERLDSAMRGILGLTPARTLGRGYALVRGQGGQVVTRAAQVTAGDALSLEFVDGQVGVTAASGG